MEGECPISLPNNNNLTFQSHRVYKQAWQKQWCEIKRLDSIQNGVELKLKSGADGAVLNCVVLPRSSTICRTESRTKQYAFGVFIVCKTQQKPILFLSGSSENDTQEWMSAIRKMLSIASHLPGIIHLKPPQFV